jgi:hypothetical protein
MITLDGEQWATLLEASKHIGVSYQAVQKWVYRRRGEIPTKRVGAAIVVQLGSLSGYQKRVPRKIGTR